MCINFGQSIYPFHLPPLQIDGFQQVARTTNKITPVKTSEKIEPAVLEEFFTGEILIAETRQYPTVVNSVD